MPEYPGGNEALYSYLQKEIYYPEYAKENQITGTVYIRFVVEKDGSLTDFQILKGVDEVLNKEALRVIKKLPDFSPGKKYGEPVRVYYTIPVKFTLK